MEPSPSIGESLRKRWPWLSYLIAFKELIAFIVLITPVLRFAFQSPDLEIEYQAFRVFPPDPSIVVQALSDSTPEPFSINRDTHSVLSISIENNSTNRIEDLDLHVWGVEELLGVSLHTTNTSLKKQVSEIAETVEHSGYELRLPGLDHLPPESSVVVQIWGTVRLRPYGRNVSATSSADRPLVQKRATATGVGLFLATNVQPLAFVTLVWLLVLGIRRVGRKE